METVGQPPAEAELHLLTDWSDPDARSRHRMAAAGAIGINVAIVAAMWLLPEAFFKPPDLPEVVQRVTPLMMPLPELTQRDPNHGKVSREFEVQAPQAPRRAIQMPPMPPPLKGEEAPKPAPPAPLPEPPKVEIARETPPAELPRPVQQTAAPPPPQIQTEEKPKLRFENPPQPTGPLPLDQRRIPLPTEALSNIAREAAGSGGSPVGTVVGDAGASGTGFNGFSQSPTPGNPLANVQLRSDTEGVDFKPYLMQLIATIKRNWLAVIPESARMGRRGKVSLQFVIARDGNIDKVVYAEQSGSSALDRAAVAGVSASNPLPPLPRDFKGNRIVLQLNFVYR
jgi:TonB family protein